MDPLGPLIDAFNNCTRVIAATYDKELSSLKEKLADAMRFIPYPETMSGYCDPDAPDEVKETIAIAAKLHGRALPECDAATHPDLAEPQGAQLDT